jgi:hypothetical protein
MGGDKKKLLCGKILQSPGFKQCRFTAVKVEASEQYSFAGGRSKEV